MRNKSLVNNLQSFVLLINKFQYFFPVLSMLILMCKIGHILMFFLDQKWAYDLYDDVDSITNQSNKMT